MGTIRRRMGVAYRAPVDRYVELRLTPGVRVHCFVRQRAPAPWGFA